MHNNASKAKLMSEWLAYKCQQKECPDTRIGSSIFSQSYFKKST